MKLNKLTKSLTLAASALGMIVLVPFANIAMAQTSGPATDVIDLSIDVNQDGVSDQLLEATQQTQAYQQIELERLQAIGVDEPGYEMAYETYLANTTAANLQLDARMPYSDNVRQAVVQIDQLVAQYEQYREPYGEGGPEQSVLETQMRQISESISQDSSLLEVTNAQIKVYDVLSKG